MSGFISNRGASFAAKYKEFASKPVTAGVKNDVKNDVENEVEIETVSEIVKKEDRKYSKAAKAAKIETIDDDEAPVKVEVKEQVLLEESDESLISLEDSEKSYEEEEEFQQSKEETLNVKLKFDGKIHRFVVEIDSPLWKNLDEFYKTLGVSKKSHELVLTLNDKVLSMKDSPKKLNLTIVDILECYAKERSEGSDDKRKKKSKEPKDPNVLEIKFRNNEDGKHAVPVTLRINKNDNMKLIMEEYAKTKGYKLSELIFDFDGDRLAGDETPIDLDIEDGSLIDVTVKKQK